MSLDFLWFLPTAGDTRYLGTTKGSRPVSNQYLQQIAVAADNLGYDGILIPTGRGSEDPWITAATLVSATRRLRFLVAVRTALTLPTAAARMAATLDRASGGRLMINVVPGGDPVELAGDGIFLDHDERYEEADEFLTIWRGLLEGKKVDFEGKYHKVVGGKHHFPPVQEPHPPIYFGGSSPAAHELAGKHVDAYLTWGEPPAAVAEKIADVRAKAAKHGRTVRFGIRLHVIVRETNEEAWAAAETLISNIDDEKVAEVQKHYSSLDSVGQQRMAALHGGQRDKLEVSPNLWAGVGLVRGGAGTALVGDPQTVAARLKEYADLGIESFVLSGYPHLEEAYRFAELVFPLLPGKSHLVSTATHAVTGGPFDAIVDDKRQNKAA